MRSPLEEDDRQGNSEDPDTRLSLPGASVGAPSAAVCRDCPFRGYCLPRGLEWLHVGKPKRLMTLPKVVHRGDALYRAGQSLPPLYFIKAGSVKIAIPSATGADRVVRFHLAGELVGADGLNGSRIESTAVALETSGLCQLPAHQIEALFLRFPEVQQRLIKRLAEQLARAQAMLLIVGRQGAEERLAAFLVDLIGRLQARGSWIEELSLSMTRCDIGSYLGLAVETVSRAFRRLQAKGLVSVRGRRVGLKDIGALQALARLPLEASHPNGLTAAARDILETAS